MSANETHYRDSTLGACQASVPLESTQPSVRASTARLDVVIPVYNEQAVLELLLGRLGAVFSSENLAEHGISATRLVMVDDGSTDASAQMIHSRIREGLSARLIRLSRNFGHQNAISAGMDHCEADIVVIMDADLQDPPELVLEMVDRWRRGADGVFARRRNRKENVLKKAGYWAFYRIVGLLSDIRLPLDTGDFCLMDRRVLLAIRALPENLRFPRGLRAWVGFRQEGMEFDRPPRLAGSPKYTWSKLYRLATDGIAAMSTRPLQVAQVGSFFFGILTLGFLGWLLVSSLLSLPTAFSRQFLLAYVLIASGNAVQALCLYILGAYVSRMYLEVKGRPTYIVMEVVDPAPTSKRTCEDARPD